MRQLVRREGATGGAAGEEGRNRGQDGRFSSQAEGEARAKKVETAGQVGGSRGREGKQRVSKEGQRVRPEGASGAEGEGQQVRQGAAMRVERRGHWSEGMVRPGSRTITSGKHIPICLPL